MNLDLRQVPFSRHGSYLAFSHLRETDNRPSGLYLRTVHGDTVWMGTLCRVELVRDGQPIPFTEIATPTVLRLESDAGYAEICIAEPKVIRVRGKGVGLRLSVGAGTYDNAIAAGGDRWQIVSFSNRIKLMLTPLAGRLAVDAPWAVDRSAHIVADFTPDPETGVAAGAIEEFLSTWTPRDYADDFETCVRRVDEAFQRWLDATPTTPLAYAPARALAAYINWSSVVAPEGHLRRPAMYMSKNWMTNVWSWDHCFNAMALVYHNPQLAWDQFMVMIDVQDAAGAFPDMVNDNQLSWSFRKPPIHGWALTRMMERADAIDNARLQEAYAPLCRWTEWWFTYHDDNRNGIPQYNHGNDSGWDNATVFHAASPVECPDLSAFLVLQMETLANVAQKLGKASDARAWKARADDLLAKMLAHFWQEDHFIARRSVDGAPIAADSLLLSLPIVLGRRLPDAVLKPLIAGLKRFITAHGLATEHPSSPHYIPDGYWRGPIWAPSTMLIIDGLRAAGEEELARDLSRKFCDMALRSGMAENYDALTGEGLRDRAYTWTSSVFLILAHEYLQ